MLEMPIAVLESRRARACAAAGGSETRSVSAALALEGGAKAEHFRLSSLLGEGRPEAVARRHAFLDRMARAVRGSGLMRAPLIDAANCRFVEGELQLDLLNVWHSSRQLQHPETERIVAGWRHPVHLGQACYFGRVDLVERAVAAGAALDGSDFGGDPVAGAAEAWVVTDLHIACVQRLYASGVPATLIQFHSHGVEAAGTGRDWELLRLMVAQAQKSADPAARGRAARVPGFRDLWSTTTSRDLHELAVGWALSAVDNGGGPDPRPPGQSARYPAFRFFAFGGKSSGTAWSLCSVPMGTSSPDDRGRRLDRWRVAQVRRRQERYLHQHDGARGMRQGRQSLRGRPGRGGACDGDSRVVPPRELAEPAPLSEWRRRQL